MSRRLCSVGGKKNTQEQTSDQSNRSPNFVNAHSDANPPAAPLYCAEFARPADKTGSWVKTTRCPPSEVCREQCPRWSQRIIARPDIFNMALALPARLNAEMRHVALASARVTKVVNRGNASASGLAHRASTSSFTGKTPHSVPS